MRWRSRCCIFSIVERIASVSVVSIAQSLRRATDYKQRILTMTQTRWLFLQTFAGKVTMVHMSHHEACVDVEELRQHAEVGACAQQHAVILESEVLLTASEKR